MDIWAEKHETFGGNFNELFEYLDKKAVHPNMDGIDFKSFVFKSCI